MLTVIKSLIILIIICHKLSQDTILINHLTENMSSSNTEEKFNLIVVGGGPSGMMCAGRAAELGAKVLLVEKNASLGNKLMLTGGGRCNITNAIFDNETFLDNFPQAKKYLYSPFSQFSVADTFNFFESRGLPLVTEARQRVFPQTQKVQDVFNVLSKYMKAGKVVVKTKVRIASLEYNNKKITALLDIKNRKYLADNFVIATGGLAAPETGATGDGLKFLKNIGHTIHASNPDLVPLKSNTPWVHHLSGLTWSFMKIRFVQNKKTKLRKLGKILFTHFGVSGPLIINSAHDVKSLLEKGPVEAIIDLFPDTPEINLDKKIIKLLQQYKEKKMKNVLPIMIFKKIALEILALPQIRLSEKEAGMITRPERKKLVHTLKNLSFNISGTCGMDKAVVADGGVELSEINFQNMSSKKYSNLYLIGDILNINRPTDGFSLQLCWTTGFVAGSHLIT